MVYDKGISVWVGNLGKYNEGHLVGDWITLPVSDDELDKFLKEKVGINEYYEEYSVFDYEYNGYLRELEISDCSWWGLYDLNLLATCIEETDDVNFEAIRTFMDVQSVSDTKLINYCNAVVQCGEIPWFPFDFIGYEYCKNESDYSKLGRQFMYDNALQAVLNDYDLEECFDYERYGESFDYNIKITDNGYLDQDLPGPDLDHYSREDLNDLFF